MILLLAQTDVTALRMGAGIAALLIIAGCVLLYFLPSFLGRNKRNFKAIFALNLLLGWTLVGWVVSLVWALAQEMPVPMSSYAQQGPARLCASCGRYSVAGSSFCTSCGASMA